MIISPLLLLNIVVVPANEITSKAYETIWDPGKQEINLSICVDDVTMHLENSRDS